MENLYDSHEVPIILRNFKLNGEGAYSITKPHEASQIVKCIEGFIDDHILYNKTITDGSACMGGDLVRFCTRFKIVNGIEIDPDNFRFLVKNVHIFGCENANLFCQDYTEIYKSLKQDIIYLDPQWGGPDYKTKDVVYLKFGNYELWEFIRDIINENITKYIFIKVPLNVCLENIKYNMGYIIFNKSGIPSFKLICIKTV
jgi:hypothetical protein